LAVVVFLVISVVILIAAVWSRQRGGPTSADGGGAGPWPGDSGDATLDHHVHHGASHDGGHDGGSHDGGFEGGGHH
jgi:hypothetical protein